VATKWKAFTYSAKMKRNSSVMHYAEDVTNLSLIDKVEAPPSPVLADDQEVRARMLWDKMLFLRHEINRLKEKYHVGGG
jgi:hypothetical protein